MDGDYDKAPRPVDDIIDINIQEESTVLMILQELQQHYPSEGIVSLLARAKTRIGQKVRAGSVGFMYRKCPAGFADISNEEGLELLKHPGSWDPKGDEDLVVYEKRS